MNHTATDVIIHTRNPLSEPQFEEVANQVKRIDGVLRFYRDRNRPNFIMVVYNTAQIRAIAILNKLTRLGFNASLVGI